MELIITNTLPLDETFSITSLIGGHVITPRGFVVGRVSQVRLNPQKRVIEGLVVRRGLFRKIYIDKNYVEKISPESIVLSIEPSIFLMEKKVVTSEGKVLGRVTQINRIKDSNDISSLIVKPFFKKSFEVPSSAIQMIGSTIMLKKSYGKD